MTEKKKLGQKTYISNSGNEFIYSELMDCPFCGNKPELIFIGNDHTKTRKIEIKCPNCRAKMINAALRYSHLWIAKKSIDQWNTRVNQPLKQEQQ